MEWSKESRITAIVVAGLVMVALFGFSVLSGSQIDAGEIIDLIIGMAAGVLGGMAAGAGKAKS